MASITHLRRAPQGADADLKVKHDDFSVQVETNSDRMFWVRVERTMDDVVRVSDLKRSSLSYERVAAALELAVSAATNGRPPSSLVFLDVAPSVRDPDLAKQRADAEAAHISRILVLYSSSMGFRITRVEQVSRGAKHDVQVYFDKRT